MVGPSPWSDRVQHTIRPKVFGAPSRNIRLGPTVGVIQALLLAVLALEISVQPARGQANLQGQWQTLSYTMPINPIHIALMHTGKVLVVSGSENVPGNTNYQAAVWDPQTGTITTQPVSWDMFCNGMVVLPDGRPFVVGGNLQYDPFKGLPYTAVFDPSTGTFTNLQNMAHGRWYPTATTLSDGSVMVFSGLLETSGTNNAVEIYKVGTGWSQQFIAPWTPPLYPRMHLLPDGRVFYSGPSPASSIFDPTTRTWTLNVAFTNYGNTRTYGSSVLLPLTPANGYKPRVMLLGGGAQGGGPATATTEIIDLSASNPAWQYGPSMSQPRIEMNAVILPNGKVLALGGSTNDEDATTASLNGDLYDPATSTFSSAGANTYPRLYHSNGILLPDATVAVTGGNPTRGTYEPHIEIYSPPYLFTTSACGTVVPAIRPKITSVNSGVIGYNNSFQVLTPDADNIASVVLARAGAVTHAFDMDQRLVGLSFTGRSGVLNVTGPPSSNIAPPGYYMLFILNTAGVPSVANFVQVSPAPTDLPPTATITSPTSNQTITAGQSIFFSGTGSDPDGTITAYSWTFPGGNPSTSILANPGFVTFSTPGTYIVYFTVTDNAGLTNTQGVTVTVQPASGSLIPQANWSLKFVDSQECMAQIGAAVNSFDGNPNTMWHTQWSGANPPPPHEIQINLGASYNVSGFLYLPRQDGCANGWISQYEFYVSVDGVNWGTPVATGTFNYGTASTTCPGAPVLPALQISFTPTTGRYVRLRALSEVNGNPWTSMAELNVLASSVSPSTTVSSLTLNPTSVTGGSSSQGTVTLSGAAPSGGAVVSLSSSNTAVATVPASVTVAAGATSATFTVTTSAVAASTSVTISATYGSTKTATLTVQASGTSAIPQTGWSLLFVDSQETACQNGAAVNSFDGNPNTMWHTQWCPTSAPLPHEIQINLGASYNVSGFLYLPRQDGCANGWISQYEFYVSVDGVNWGTPVATGTFNYGVATTTTCPGQPVLPALQVSFTPTTGRYVRLRALSEVNGNPWTSMAELNVLGTR